MKPLKRSKSSGGAGAASMSCAARRQLVTSRRLMEANRWQDVDALDDERAALKAGRFVSMPERPQRAPAPGGVAAQFSHSQVGEANARSMCADGGSRLPLVTSSHWCPAQFCCTDNGAEPHETHGMMPYRCIMRTHCETTSGGGRAGGAGGGDGGVGGAGGTVAMAKEQSCMLPSVNPAVDVVQEAVAHARGK